MQHVAKRPNCLISYHYRDRNWLTFLRVELGRRDIAECHSIWWDEHSRSISEWQRLMTVGLDEAELLLVMTSSHLLSPTFVTGESLPWMVEQAIERQLPIYPIAVESTPWRYTPLESARPLLEPERPLAELAREERDQVCAEICNAVSSVLNLHRAE